MVGLTKMCSKMPADAIRESKMKSAWIRENAFAEVARICETFSWKYNTSTHGFNQGLVKQCNASH